MGVPQAGAFLDDVKQQVRTKLSAIPAITDEDINNIVKTGGNMPLPFLKKLAEDGPVCTQCGVCCQKVTPISITTSEIKTLARYLNTSPSKLRRRHHIVRTNAPDLWEMRGAPCPFLEGKNKCAVYPVRMHVCREFPFKRMCEEGAAGRQVGIHPLCPMVREAMSQFYTSRLIAKTFRRGRRW